MFLYKTNEDKINLETLKQHTSSVLKTTDEFRKKLKILCDKKNISYYNKRGDVGP